MGGMKQKSSSLPF